MYKILFTIALYYIWTQALFKKNPKDFPITILSSTPLSLNAKLIVFELYKMRYIVILNQNGATLVDKYPIEDFGELFKQEKQ